jgi:hypothetical protein
VSAALAEGPENASTRLLGHYFLVMGGSATGETGAFVDAGGFYRAYTDGLRVSDSLFALAPPAMHFSDIWLDAMAEFATYGAVHGGDTLLPSVRLIEGDFASIVVGKRAMAAHHEGVTDERFGCVWRDRNEKISDATTQ